MSKGRDKGMENCRADSRPGTGESAQGKTPERKGFAHLYKNPRIGGGLQGSKPIAQRPCSPSRGTSPAPRTPFGALQNHSGRQSLSTPPPASRPAAQEPSSSADTTHKRDSTPARTPGVTPNQAKALASLGERTFQAFKEKRQRRRHEGSPATPLSHGRTPLSAVGSTGPSGGSTPYNPPSAVPSNRALAFWPPPACASQLPDSGQLPWGAPSQLYGTILPSSGGSTKMAELCGGTSQEKKPSRNWTYKMKMPLWPVTVTVDIDNTKAAKESSEGLQSICCHTLPSPAGPSTLARPQQSLDPQGQQTHQHTASSQLSAADLASSTAEQCLEVFKNPLAVAEGAQQQPLSGYDHFRWPSRIPGHIAARQLPSRTDAATSPGVFSNPLADMGSQPGGQAPAGGSQQWQFLEGKDVQGQAAPELGRTLAGESQHWDFGADRDMAGQQTSKQAVFEGFHGSRTVEAAVRQQDGGPGWARCSEDTGAAPESTFPQLWTQASQAEPQVSPLFEPVTSQGISPDRQSGGSPLENSMRRSFNSNPLYDRTAQTEGAGDAGDDLCSFVHEQALSPVPEASNPFLAVNAFTGMLASRPASATSTATAPCGAVRPNWAALESSDTASMQLLIENQQMRQERQELKQELRMIADRLAALEASTNRWEHGGVAGGGPFSNSKIKGRSRSAPRLRLQRALEGESTVDGSSSDGRSPIAARTRSGQRAARHASCTPSPLCVSSSPLSTPEISHMSGGKAADAGCSSETRRSRSRSCRRLSADSPASLALSVPGAAHVPAWAGERSPSPALSGASKSREAHSASTARDRLSRSPRRTGSPFRAPSNENLSPNGLSLATHLTKLDKAVASTATTAAKLGLKLNLDDFRPPVETPYRSVPLGTSLLGRQAIPDA